MLAGRLSDKMSSELGCAFALTEYFCFFRRFYTMDSEIFEKLPPTKLFFRLAIPSMITMAFGALYQIGKNSTKVLDFSILLRYTAQRQKKKNCKYHSKFRKSVQAFHVKVVCPTFWDRPPSEAAISSFFRSRRFL